MKFAHVRGQLSDAGLADMIEEMKELPAQVEMMLGNQSRIQKFANRYLAARSIFFIGRGIDYAISLEGSLKLKEVSYIHSEAYAAGELKHGTISLIEEGTLVCAVMTQEDLYKKTLSNMVEVKTRGAFVMAVTNVDNTEAGREIRRLRGLYPEDEQIFYQLPGDHPPAAFRLLRGRGPGMRRG